MSINFEKVEPPPLWREGGGVPNYALFLTNFCFTEDKNRNIVA